MSLMSEYLKLARRMLFVVLWGLVAPGSAFAAGNALQEEVAGLYDKSLEQLFKHFHANPELSFVEVKTAARMAEELSALGYDVHTGIARTGVVALLRNGAGPLVMMRADMDGLPVKERSGLPYASQVMQENLEGQRFPVMHACGHDVHITSLIGTAQIMAAHKETWSGTLMLIAQPAEEWKDSGAAAMRAAGIWERFGTPDFALGFHVAADIEAGKLFASRGAAYSAVDSLDIVVPGIGAHGASPHRGRDPIVIGAQIVMALQTIVAREVSPREPAVVTVGVFRAGNKRNVIGEEARLELTVRSDSGQTRTQLLAAIERIAVNIGRAGGLPESQLPYIELKGGVPVTENNADMASQVLKAWADELGEEIIAVYEREGMGGEDFPFFTQEPLIPSVYFSVGGTPLARVAAFETQGQSLPSHHSPLFQVEPRPAVISGILGTVIALRSLMQNREIVDD
jgi:amidohydrolase